MIMDPRNPELAVKRLRDLMSQYDRIEHDILTATTKAQIGQLEREGGLVVQEMCLVAPRIHEAMMQTSRQRRYGLSHPIPAEVLKPATAETIEKYIEDAKPKKTKKKTSKKKTTKKAED